MQTIGISTRNAVLGLHTTLPRLELTITGPLLRVNSSLGQMRIETPEIRVMVDSSEQRADMGFKDIRTFADDLKTKARETVLEGTAKIARMGDELARIEDESGPGPADVAASSAWPPPGEFNVALVPKDFPEVDVEQTGRFEVDVEPAEIEVRLEPGTVQGYLVRGVVETYLRQKPYVDIQV